MKRLGLFCKKELVPELKKLLNGPWIVSQIESAPQAWSCLQKSVFNAIIFYFDNVSEEHLSSIRRIREEIEDLPIILLAEHIDEEIEYLDIAHFALFELEKDSDILVAGLEKLLSGKQVFYRKEKRYRAHPFVSIVSSIHNGSRTLRMANISRSGAELHGHVGFAKVGEKVFIKSETSNVPAVIRWVGKNGKSIQKIGIEFIN